MIGALADKITKCFVKNSIVSYEDQEIYTYGLHQGIIMIVNILTFILIGLSFRMIRESLMFMIFYIPLRTYAGGYHAKTPTSCYILSIFMIILVLLAVKTVSWTISIIIGISLLSGIIIFALSPVEDKNKPLSDSQMIRYRQMARAILAIELIGIAVLLYGGYSNVALPMVLSVATGSIMVVLGRGVEIIRIRKNQI